MTGAKLYQDEAGFSPHHTLILLTNDRPVLPPTASFKGRLVFVPFNADFTDSKDLTLEDDLKREAPGILWKLIQTAPSIFVSGIQPPSAVLDATADLVDENDVAAPFIEQRLVADPEAVTPREEMQDAVRKWLGRMMADDAVERIMEGIKMRYAIGRKRVKGSKTIPRGFIGVRILSSS